MQNRIPICTRAARVAAHSNRSVHNRSKRRKRFAIDWEPWNRPYHALPLLVSHSPRSRRQSFAARRCWRWPPRRYVPRHVDVTPANARWQCRFRWIFEVAYGKRTGIVVSGFYVFRFYFFFLFGWKMEMWDAGTRSVRCRLDIEQLFILSVQVVGWSTIKKVGSIKRCTRKVLCYALRAEFVFL